MRKNLVGADSAIKLAGLLIDLLQKYRNNEQIVLEQIEWFLSLTKEERIELMVFNKKPSPFPIWKIVKRDTALRTADDFRRAFKKKGIRVGDWANDILGRIPIASDGAEFNLVIATTKELTGKDCASTAEVFAGAAHNNLEKCPADIGPLLRDQYKNQPNGERLLIGMEPISDSDLGGDLRVFNVRHAYDGLWLRSLYGYPGGFWDGDDRWVFVRKSR